MSKPLSWLRGHARHVVRALIFVVAFVVLATSVNQTVTHLRADSDLPDYDRAEDVQINDPRLKGVPFDGDEIRQACLDAFAALDTELGITAPEKRPGRPDHYDPTTCRMWSFLGAEPSDDGPRLDITVEITALGTAGVSEVTRWLQDSADHYDECDVAAGSHGYEVELPAGTFCSSGVGQVGPHDMRITGDFVRNRSRVSVEVSITRPTGNTVDIVDSVIAVRDTMVSTLMTSLADSRQ